MKESMNEETIQGDLTSILKFRVEDIILPANKTGLVD